MNTKTTGKNRINTVLIFFILLNAIGDIGNVIFWHANPSSQGSIVGGVMGDVPLKGGYINSVLGASATLAFGSVTLIIVAAIYLIAMFGLFKKQNWGPLLVIAISIVNRVIAAFLYELSMAFTFWAVWTVILVAVAFLDYRKLTTNPQTPVAAQT
jgi:uncharacterized membrane protein